MQDTLAEATAMLTELESNECLDMEISQGNSEDGLADNTQDTEKYGSSSVDFSLDGNEDTNVGIDQVDVNLW